MPIGIPELLIILGILVLIFGARSIPKLARSMKQAIVEFKEESQASNSQSDQKDPENSDV